MTENTVREIHYNRTICQSPLAFYHFILKSINSIRYTNSLAPTVLTCTQNTMTIRKVIQKSTKV